MKLWSKQKVYSSLSRAVSKELIVCGTTFAFQCWDTVYFQLQTAYEVVNGGMILAAAVSGCSLTITSPHSCLFGPIYYYALPAVFDPTFYPCGFCNPDNLDGE